MNASLINIVHLEAELAASSLLVEEHESEIKKLRTENGTIKSELAGMKTWDTTQKSKLKKLTQDDDKLRRELSKYSGVRKFTVDTETQQATSEEITKLKDELSVVQAKLYNLRDHVKTYASQIFDIVTDASSNVTSNGDVNFGEVCLSPKFVVISCFLSYALIFVQIHLSILCITSFHILRYVCLLSSS